MRIEIIKTDNGFRIPQLEFVRVPDHFFATVELSSTDEDSLNPSRENITHRLLKKSIVDLGGDLLLEGILSRLPQNYAYIPSAMSDEDVLYEALQEKYGL